MHLPLVPQRGGGCGEDVAERMRCGLGEGIQWWTYQVGFRLYFSVCPDSMARALWKKDVGRGTLGVPTMPFWESSMNQVNPASRVAGRLTNKYRPWRCWLRGE